MEKFRAVVMIDKALLEECVNYAPINSMFIFLFLNKPEEAIAHWNELNGPIDDEATRSRLKSHLGFAAARFPIDQRLLIEEFFDVECPVFGRAAIMGEPSPIESYKCGLEFGLTLKELRDRKVDNHA